MKYHKDHGRYENFGCSIDLHHIGAVIKDDDTLVLYAAPLYAAPLYTCLLCEMTKSKKPVVPAVALSFGKVVKN